MKIMSKQIRTKRGAIRRYDAIIRQCYRDLRGGTQYGIDMPTLRVVFPERAAEIASIKAMFASLPN
jgi:hypothetical protein